jgi:protein ImuB
MNAASSPGMNATAPRTTSGTPSSPIAPVPSQKSSARPHTRIACLFLPFLASDRIRRGRHGPRWRSITDEKIHAPLVLAHKHKSALRIAAMDERATELGLRIDQGLADARAQFPSIDVVAHAPDADRALLESIADWCDRYTPLVACDGNHGLFLDITGCAHLFGGEQVMARDMMERLFRQGFAARIAIADTAGAAHGAARCGGCEGPVHVPSTGEFQALAGLGLHALRLAPDMVAALERTGLKTVAALADVPRAALARRFGREPLLRLDQALGACDEVLSPRLPVAEMSAERRLASPVSDMDHFQAGAFSQGRSRKTGAGWPAVRTGPVSC